MTLKQTQEKAGYRSGAPASPRNTKAGATGRDDGQNALPGGGNPGSIHPSTNYPHKMDKGKHGTGGSEPGPLGNEVRGYRDRSKASPSTHKTKVTH